MAIKGSSLPFKRGETYFGSGTPSTTDEDGLAIEGNEYEVWDATYDVPVILKVVRNSAAAALESKRLIIAKAGKKFKETDGYHAVDPTLSIGYVDFEYGTKTVAVNDLFFAIVGGYAIGLTDLAGADENVIAEGAYLVGLTAATTGATTAGRVHAALFTGSTTTLANQITRCVGRAASAKTTAQTNGDVLISLRNCNLA